nr:MAG TPA: major capsid protein [Caudoviricetes sp.]
MEFENMTMEQIESRVAEIQSKIDNATAEEISAFTEEMQKLNERKTQLKDIAEKRSQLKANVQAFGVQVKTPFTGATSSEERLDASSKEYRNAWVKRIARDADNRPIFGEMTDTEKRAFTFTTENTGVVVPTEIINRIVDLTDNDSPLYDDAMKSNFKNGFIIPRLTEITAGDAKVVNEGEANDDEQDEFDSLEITSVEIKKHIVLTRKMEFQSIDAFLDWLVNHLASRIRVAKENYILTQLGKTSTGIATANTLQASALTDAEIRKAMSMLRGSGERVLYANQGFIWNTLAGLEDSSGNKLFIPSPRVDPVVEGSVYGTIVKRDSNIPDNTMYIGYPKKLDFNEFIPFDITPQIESKTLNRIFVGYSLCGAGLEDPLAFVKWSQTGAG